MTAYTDYADHTDSFVRRTGPGRKGLVFPVKLFLLLKYIDLKEPHLKTIISWNHHGRSFKIHDHKQFRQIILPRFFASTSSETFRRQLSFWGLRRISGSGKKREEIGSYYHEKFLRSKDYLCRLIRRNGASGPLLDSEEPDFERMKAMPTSEQRRLSAPESDDELFAVLLSTSSNDAGATKRNGTQSSSSLLESSANVDAMSMKPSLVDSTSLHPFSNSYSNQLVPLLTNNMTITSTTLDPSSASSNHLQLTSAVTSNAPAASANDATNTMNPSLNSNLSFSNNYLNQQASLLTTTDITTSSFHPPLPMQTFDATTSNTNQEVAHNDRRRQAYQDIDLEQLLSDENEWQWRHLQPFPIGFQPPLSPRESEEMDKFMSFIRRCTE
ncbi:hypothetical protein CTEN210_18347 [Chaetoceros tenuissimus]|uniref:HSF-type DNA-binding domain-containing protein n=1 Tax=Chaetoceros tenuissimus TaxID=426638 RepID=A0AAD3DCN7_9STRA|nr:hypothetical protein CTEN210_18347 [Chaetoceros tenuissimus]